jgi:hypothetical protein
VLSQRQPRLSRAWLASGIGVLALAGAAAVAARRAGAARLAPGPRAALVPFLWLALWNALAFAASLDLVHPRYALFDHALALGLLFAAALSGVTRAEPVSAASSP